jgi:hypothetical protein
MPLDDLRLQLTRKVTTAAASIAREWERELQDTSPVASGRMRQSTTAKVSGSSGRITVTATIDTDYAEMVATGTRPHVITPVRAQVLSFFWDKVGEQVYFARVNHPGGTPRTWWADSLRGLPDLVQRAWRGAR